MSSKRRIRRRSCKGKIRYSDSSSAKLVADRMQWPYHSYPCKFCGGFHVGRYSVADMKAISQSRRARHGT